MTFTRREKNLIGQRARHAKKIGMLIAQPCCKCGAVRAEMHHRDYSKPFDVIWLCRKHHMDEHSRGVLACLRASRHLPILKDGLKDGDIITPHQLLGLLAEVIEECGSIRQWATAHGVSAAYVSAVMLGKSRPGASILEPLNIEKIVTYDYKLRT